MNSTRVSAACSVTTTFAMRPAPPTASTAIAIRSASTWSARARRPFMPFAVPATWSTSFSARSTARLAPASPVTAEANQLAFARLCTWAGLYTLEALSDMRDSTPRAPSAVRVLQGEFDGHVPDETSFLGLLDCRCVLHRHRAGAASRRCTRHTGRLELRCAAG